MQFWRNFIARMREKRGEFTITDNRLAPVHSGELEKRERAKRRLLIKEIDALMQSAYEKRVLAKSPEQGAINLDSGTIRPVAKVRRPLRLPWLHHKLLHYNDGEVVALLSKSEVEVAILEFNLHGIKTKLAFTAKGALYQHYVLHVNGRNRELWLSLYDHTLPKVSLELLRAAKEHLKQVIASAS